MPKVIEPAHFERALRLASSAGNRVYARPAPIREGFVRAHSETRPPLSRIMTGGGRGGEVRLKLYLSMLWIAAAPPYETTFPSRGWAELLGLWDPETAGARRVADALVWLASERLVRTQPMQGKPSVVYLLDDAGRGIAYKPPGVVHERYLKLPPSFWMQGWHVVLSAAAIALLLVLRDQQSLEPNKSIWVSPSRARELYMLSPDTWTKGTHELQDHGLVSIAHIPVSADAFGWRRVRNTYRFEMQRLDNPPKLGTE